MNKTILKNKFAILGAAVIVAAILAISGIVGSNNADADQPSPIRHSAHQNGFNIAITSCTPDTNLQYLRLKAYNHVAKNCSGTPKANFYLYSEGGTPETPMSVTLNCGYDDRSRVAGQSCWVYIEYEDGRTEMVQCTFDSNGNVTFNMTGTGYISLVTDFKPGGGGHDGGDTSPQTGVR